MLHVDVIGVPKGELVEREPVVQILLDPEHGLVKRETHFAIEGYLKSSVLGASNQSSAFARADPHKYAECFFKCLETIFQ